MRKPHFDQQEEQTTYSHDSLAHYRMDCDYQTGLSPGHGTQAEAEMSRQRCRRSAVVDAACLSTGTDSFQNQNESNEPQSMTWCLVLL